MNSFGTYSRSRSCNPIHNNNNNNNKTNPPSHHKQTQLSRVESNPPFSIQYYKGAYYFERIYVWNTIQGNNATNSTHDNQFYNQPI
mmetsp:Transcript_10860/g.31587  ORF Transcript_10860/g.31587 Transcript_10860/m.31587 type:complete len:86 (-) Transcript_10860:153-410(-)